MDCAAFLPATRRLKKSSNTRENFFNGSTKPRAPRTRKAPNHKQQGDVGAWILERGYLAYRSCRVSITSHSIRADRNPWVWSRPLRRTTRLGSFARPVISRRAFTKRAGAGESTAKRAHGKLPG